jgi:hypothetical protein
VAPALPRPAPDPSAAHLRLLHVLVRLGQTAGGRVQEAGVSDGLQ